MRLPSGDQAGGWRRGRVRNPLYVRTIGVHRVKTNVAPELSAEERQPGAIRRPNGEMVEQAVMGQPLRIRSVQVRSRYLVTDQRFKLIISKNAP